MNPSAKDAYLETQINTSTPQRLRLMLIEGALRRARATETAWQAKDFAAGDRAIRHCREIVCELIAGIQPEKSPLAQQILGIYMFLFSALIEIEAARDQRRLPEIIRVLEEERQTWHAVCEKMPERPVAAAPATEELAPQRVADAWTCGYGVPAPVSRKRPAEAFSIEA